jgi:hypothetical protein
VTDTTFSKEALPTQSGSYRAWRPEYQSGDTLLSLDGWRPVPTRESAEGIPMAGPMQGINHTICMCSYAQANALAWAYAASVEAATGRAVEVRVAEYQIAYDIKCYRAEFPIEPELKP